jgi:hypothetical protein
VLGDTFYEGDRTEALANLQIAGGAEIYFDALGNFVFDAPAGTSPVMWTVNAGDEGVLVDAGESLDRTGVYNGVLVQGQQYAAQPPVAALVVDSDASSPTRWGGPFGKVARLETSTVVQTTQQAVDAANALLDVRLGLTRSLTLAAAPNPALEAGDVIRVDFGDGRIEQHVIDAVRTGLGAADGQELSTRSVFVPALDAQIPLPDRRRALFGNEAWRELRQAKRVSVAA